MADILNEREDRELEAAVSELEKGWLAEKAAERAKVEARQPAGLDAFVEGKLDGQARVPRPEEPGRKRGLKP